MSKKFKFLFVFIALLVVFVAPFAVFADDPAPYVTARCEDYEGLEKALCSISLILNTLIPILITLAVVYFIWGVIQYVIGSDEDDKSKGRNKMIYGLIGLAVIVSIWGLVTILKNTFGIDDQSQISIPCIAAPGVNCPTGTSTP